VTRELGHQSEIELQTKLQNEIEAERVTRLDEMLLSEQQEEARSTCDQGRARLSSCGRTATS